MKKCGFTNNIVYNRPVTTCSQFNYCFNLMFVYSKVSLFCVVSSILVGICVPLTFCWLMQVKIILNKIIKINSLFRTTSSRLSTATSFGFFFFFLVFSLLSRQLISLRDVFHQLAEAESSPAVKSLWCARGHFQVAASLFFKKTTKFQVMVFHLQPIHQKVCSWPHFES